MHSLFEVYGSILEEYDEIEFLLKEKRRFIRNVVGTTFVIKQVFVIKFQSYPILPILTHILQNDYVWMVFISKVVLTPRQLQKLSPMIKKKVFHI